MKDRNEVGRELTLLAAKNYRDTAEVCDKVIDVIKEFDGKVFNVKFERALQERIPDKRIYAEKMDSNRAYVYRYYDDKTVKDSEYSCSYTENHFDVILNYPLNEDKRINADEWIEDIKQMQEQLLIRAMDLEASVDKIDAWKEKIKALTREFNDTVDKIPGEVSRYYGVAVNKIWNCIF